MNELLGADPDIWQDTREALGSGEKLILNARDACKYPKMIVSKEAEAIADLEGLLDQLRGRSVLCSMNRMNSGMNERVQWVPSAISELLKEGLNNLL